MQPRATHNKAGRGGSYCRPGTTYWGFFIYHKDTNITVRASPEREQYLTCQVLKTSSGSRGRAQNPPAENENLRRRRALLILEGKRWLGLSVTPCHIGWSFWTLLILFNVIIKENDSIEIEAATREMFLRIKTNFWETWDETKSNQKIFWNKFPYQKNLHGKITSNIGKEFLIKNNNFYN